MEVPSGINRSLTTRSHSLASNGSHLRIAPANSASEPQKPLPNVRANGAGRPESPTSTIREQAGELNNLQQITPPVEKKGIEQRSQIEALNEQQNSIQKKQESLQREEQKIEQAIDSLKQEELQIIRKKLQLSVSLPKGTQLNLVI